MKKHLRLASLLALSTSTLLASNPCPQKEETKEAKKECETICCKNCGILNPYQNNECTNTLVIGVGFVSGVFAPQNLVVAQNGVYDCRVSVPPGPGVGQFIDAKIKWASGLQFTLGFTGPGVDAVGVVAETFFVMKDSGKSLTILDNPSAGSMKTTYPFDLVSQSSLATSCSTNIQANDYASPLGDVYKAGAQYINRGYAFTTLMITRPQVRTPCSILLSEIGLSTSLLNHEFDVFYSENVTSTSPTGTYNHQYITDETIFSIGPHFRLRTRQLVGNCFTLEGMMGVAGHIQTNNVNVAEIYVTPTGVVSSRVDVAKAMRRWTHLVEGKVGINFHACFSSVGGFCAGLPPTCPKPEISFTALEFGLSWNFHARPAYTMVTDVPFGIGAGTMQPWIAQYLVASLRVKI